MQNFIVVFHMLFFRLIGKLSGIFCNFQAKNEKILKKVRKLGLTWRILAEKSGFMNLYEAVLSAKTGSKAPRAKSFSRKSGVSAGPELGRFAFHEVTVKDMPRDKSSRRTKRFYN